MIILQLIVKGTRVKALVKDKRKALEAFGSYVEVGSVNIYSWFYQLFLFTLANIEWNYNCEVDDWRCKRRAFLKESF
jgi:hypothetical protein